MKHSKSEKRVSSRRRKRIPKSVDFVLVYNKNTVIDEANTQLLTFLFNLSEKGFELETVTFSLDENINFVKIHAPREVLLHFAEIFGIELAFQNLYFRPSAPKPYKFMATELTAVDSSVYQRTGRAVSEEPSRDVTSAEKGLIIYKVLTVNDFSSEESGIEKLLNKNVFESAYPLHDGPFEWTEEGSLNDRQLLTKFWSSLKCWYKQQPLDLIEKYYGPQTAFYFAWLGFYNRMLIFASIVGVLCFLLGAVLFLPSLRSRSEEVCNSSIILCPRCLVENCRYGHLKASCFYSYLLHLFDNPLVVTFAALMSIWCNSLFFFSLSSFTFFRFFFLFISATVFLELWKREEAMLQIRWNLQSIESDYSMRPEFEKTAKYKKLSNITGNLEPYIPQKILCCRYTFTVSTLLLLIILTMLVILGVMIYVKTVNIVLTRTSKDQVLTKNVAMIASSSGAIMSVIFILSIEVLYRKIAMWLTKMENPRTEVDFDNSYTYKSYALAFVSNYSVIFYIAFIKARFYTYPGDKKLWTVMGGLGSDLCDPAGCIIDLSMQLAFILLAKNLMMTAKQYVLPQISIFFTKFKKKKRKIKSADVTLQWESDYLLNPVHKYQLMDEYLQMIIQYGFVTFFVAAFPLAPLLALINNLIELRVDAFKYTCAFRRPVAIKIANIGAWNGILKGVTYVGVATNAFVIAFTSELVQRTVYLTSEGNMSGFVNSTLSVYNVSEFPSTFRSHLNISVCYYPGKRYPPDHPRRYEFTDLYWYELSMKFLTVVVFEHVVMIVTGIVAYAIPDIPFTVRELVHHHKGKINEMRLNKTLQANYLEERDEKADVFKGLY